MASEKTKALVDAAEDAYAVVRYNIQIETDKEIEAIQKEIDTLIDKRVLLIVESFKRQDEASEKAYDTLVKARAQYDKEQLAETEARLKENNGNGNGTKPVKKKSVKAVV